jgi:hypothetical protein
VDEPVLRRVIWNRVDQGFESTDDADVWCDWWRYLKKTDQQQLSCMPTFMTKNVPF